ncbi:hypothetical protein BKM31_12840 [[Actinomadura] parvosata subsp. kistnae]|uniref:histidine kinase n=1 Tax=[Actinomadura] parvosata subsp. kistnae TaxID=1909395 RepID=A0A1U9ZWA7_9ACTN|nr:sensor histidine kinase [Nonomuraea sp. ATCC 55076]AQZ62234.1 hypothetical protein BKM31_12840 [Nonomuraea sp. ATCC 55076]
MVWARRLVTPVVIDRFLALVSAGWGLAALYGLFRDGDGDRPRSLNAFLQMQPGGQGTAAGAVLIGAGLIVVASAALLWRRTRPVTAFAVVWLAASAYFLLALPMASLDAPALSITYALGAYAPGAGGGWAAAAGAALLDAVNAFVEHLPPANVVSAWVQFGVLFLLGRGALNLRNYTREHSRRVLAEEHARTAERQAAIARELHDVISQGMAVVAAQAGGAALDRRPERVGQALRDIADIAHDALQQSHLLLERLRDGEDSRRASDDTRAACDGARAQRASDLDALATCDDVEPRRASDDTLASCDGARARRASDLHALVARFRAAGLPVDLLVTGMPPALTPARESVVYRIVQESLTNALKHTRHAYTVVRITYAEHDVTVEVTDAGPASPGPGSGQGLRGLRERVSALGGTFSAGPTREAGFRVSAELPAG